MDIQRFLGTRVRLQRLGDGKFFTGLLGDLTQSNCRISVKKTEGIEVGDQFVTQVFGHGASALLKGTVNAKSDEQIVMMLNEPIKLIQSSEQARIAVTDVKAILRYEGESIEAAVLDVSIGGAGLQVAQVLERGATIELAMDSPHGPVAAVGIVRYCRPEPDVENLFRVGVQLNGMSRVDGARWRRMFELDAA